MHVHGDRPQFSIVIHPVLLRTVHVRDNARLAAYYICTFSTVKRCAIAIATSIVTCNTPTTWMRVCLIGKIYWWSILTAYVCADLAD